MKKKSKTEWDKIMMKASKEVGSRFPTASAFCKHYRLDISTFSKQKTRHGVSFNGNGAVTKGRAKNGKAPGKFAQFVSVDTAPITVTYNGAEIKVPAGQIELLKSVLETVAMMKEVHNG